MRNIFLLLGCLFLWTLPAQAASSFKQVTFEEFTARWNAAAERDAKATGTDILYAIQSVEQTDRGTVLKLRNEKLNVRVDVQKGKVVGVFVTHHYKDDLNILGFRSIADITLESFTPFWKDAQREKFMVDKMQQGQWQQRKAEIISANEGKWSASYSCIPHFKMMLESFEIRLRNSSWK